MEFLGFCPENGLKFYADIVFVSKRVYLKDFSYLVSGWLMQQQLHIGCTSLYVVSITH